MPEKIFAWLWRLYPSHFREQYREEAMQLFRDRLEHERGWWRRAWLWLDLLADLAMSVPAQHQLAMSGAAPQLCGEGLPSFQILEGEWLRPGRFMIGCILSMAAFGTCSAMINRDIHDRRTLWMDGSGPGTSRGAYVLGEDSNEIGAAERRRVIHAIITNLKQNYADKQTGQKVADALATRAEKGEYDRVTDGAVLAEMLNKDLRAAGADVRLDVVYSGERLPDRLVATPEIMMRYREAMKMENCTFERVEVLPHNIGYVKLDAFADPSVCEPTARAAMGAVNHADAVIFDLRDNGGGMPDMVSLMASYLFDHPEYLYNPRENTTEKSWTKSPVEGNRLADKPVYVLTSARTASAAEQFSWDLKMLKRATIVGETTRGAAHAGVFHRIDDHFGVGIPEAKPINPFAKTDWEGKGVQPDVKSSAEDALEMAEKLANPKLGRK